VNRSSRPAVDIDADLTVHLGGEPISITTSREDRSLIITSSAAAMQQVNLQAFQAVRSDVEELICSSGQVVTLKVDAEPVLRFEPRGNWLGWLFGSRLGIRPLSWRTAWSLYRDLKRT